MQLSERCLIESMDLSPWKNTKIIIIIISHNLYLYGNWNLNNIAYISILYHRRSLCFPRMLVTKKFTVVFILKLRLLLQNHELHKKDETKIIG